LSADCFIYCYVKKVNQNPKIHRLIFNQAIFRLSENFLRKNRACGDHFFSKISQAY
jgi:hypothetical protein